MAVDVRHDQGVAIAGLLGDKVRRNHAGRTAPVFDDHGGVPQHAQLLTHDTCQRVRAAAGRKPHHDADRPRGQGLRSEHGRGYAGRGGSRSADESSALHHEVSGLF